MHKGKFKTFRNKGKFKQPPPFTLPPSDTLQVSHQLDSFPRIFLCCLGASKHKQISANHSHYVNFVRLKFVLKQWGERLGKGSRQKGREEERKRRAGKWPKKLCLELRYVSTSTQSEKVRERERERQQ